MKFWKARWISNKNRKKTSLRTNLKKWLNLYSKMIKLCHWFIIQNEVRRNEKWPVALCNLLHRSDSCVSLVFPGSLSANNHATLASKEKLIGAFNLAKANTTVSQYLFISEPEVPSSATSEQRCHLKRPLFAYDYIRNQIFARSHKNFPPVDGAKLQPPRWPTRRTLIDRRYVTERFMTRKIGRHRGLPDDSFHQLYRWSMGRMLNRVMQTLFFDLLGYLINVTLLGV